MASRQWKCSKTTPTKSAWWFAILGLPRLGGHDVFLRMKEIKPNVRAIVASGYLEPALRSEILRAGVLDTVQKPYDFREMMEKIRSVIGEPEAEDESQPQLF